MLLFEAFFYYHDYIMNLVYVEELW